MRTATPSATLSMLPRSTRRLALAALALAFSARGLHAQAIAVIVNKANAAESLSMDELRRLYLGKTQAFRDGAHVVVLEHGASRTPFYRSLLGLTPDEVRRRWVQLTFRGEAGALPRELADADEVRRAVAAERGAIAFVPAASLDGSVKVVAVDGRRPGDAGYPIH